MLGSFTSAGQALNFIESGQPIAYPQLLFPGGRMTLTQGTAVTTADVTGAATLYYEPYLHNRMPIFDGERVRLVTFPASSVTK